MKIFSSKHHRSWPQIEETLRDARKLDSGTITAEGLRELMQKIYHLVNGRSPADKFSDIPDMLRSIPNEVVEQFLERSLPIMFEDIVSFAAPTNSDISSATPPFLQTDLAQTISFTPTEAYIHVSMCFLSIPLFREDDSPIMDGTCHLFFTYRPRLNNKLHCMLNYFNVMVAAKTGHLPHDLSKFLLADTRRIQLTRLVTPKTHGAEWWSQCEEPLQPLEVRGNFARIESAVGAIHADFANRHIGGGVLRSGCVQEEIRMIISPETLLAVRFCEKLAPHEAVIIRNTIQFSDYCGYSSSFKCLGLSKSLLAAFQDPLFSVPLDDVLCIDAIPFGPDNAKQYALSNILRELEKCRVGLSTGCHKPFATGNWGCGVFGGDTQLKAVIQWLAASVTKHPIFFYPFDDSRTSRLPELVDLTRSRPDQTVGELFQIIIKGLLESRIREETTIDFLIETMELNSTR